MKYRRSPYDFELEVVPLGAGAFASVVRNQYVDIGSLFQSIAPTLYRTPGFTSGKFWFSLVNVACTHTGFSFGVCDIPPKEVLPIACTYYFTFALTYRRYDDTLDITDNSLRGINVRAWGHKGTHYLTIGFSHNDVQELGLKYDSLTPKYVYYLLGALTKSFALQHKYFVQDSYSSLYTLSPVSAKSAYYMAPLYSFVRNQSYHLFPYNRHIWASAPQLLAVEHITPEILLYVAMYINNIARLLPKVEAAILDKLHESLTNLVQRRNDNTPPTDADVLYAAFAFRQQIQETRPLDWLKENEQHVQLPSGNYMSHLRTLLYGNDSGAMTELKV